MNRRKVKMMAVKHLRQRLSPEAAIERTLAKADEVIKDSFLEEGNIKMKDMVEMYGKLKSKYINPGPVFFREDDNTYHCITEEDNKIKHVGVFSEYEKNLTLSNYRKKMNAENENKERIMQKMYGTKEEAKEVEYWNIKEAVSMYETIENKNSKKISSVLFPKENGAYIKVLRADSGIILVEDNYVPTEEEMKQRLKVNAEDDKTEEKPTQKEKRNVAKHSVPKRNMRASDVLRDKLMSISKSISKKHYENSKETEQKKVHCKCNNKCHANKSSKEVKFKCNECGVTSDILNNFCVLPDSKLGSKTIICNSCFNEMFGELRYIIEKKLKTNASDKTPNHYQTLIQPIDVIQMWGLDFTIGNIIKYAARVNKKENTNPIDDLNKIIHYAEIAKENILNKK